MRTINRSHPHTSTSDEARNARRHNDHDSVRRPTPQLIADGVVTSYIHDISTRHQHDESAESSDESFGHAEAA